MKVITRNAIRCKKCGDIIESNSIHDFKECSCGACFVDGGHEYLRFGGDPEDFEVLTEYGDVPGYYVTVYTHYGRKNQFSTTRDINRVIKAYEDMWDYVVVKDEDGTEIYRTAGMEDFLKRHNYD